MHYPHANEAGFILVAVIFASVISPLRMDTILYAAPAFDCKNEQTVVFIFDFYYYRTVARRIVLTVLMYRNWRVMFSAK